MGKPKSITLTNEDELESLFHSLHKQWPLQFNALDKALFVGHVLSHIDSENEANAKDAAAKEKGHDSHVAMEQHHRDEESRSRGFESEDDERKKEDFARTQTSEKTGHGFRSWAEYESEQKEKSLNAEKNAL